MKMLQRVKKRRKWYILNTISKQCVCIVYKCNHLWYSYIYTWNIFNNFLDLLLGIGIPFTIGTIKKGGTYKVRYGSFLIVILLLYFKFLNAHLFKYQIIENKWFFDCNDHPVLRDVRTFIDTSGLCLLFRGN